MKYRLVFRFEFTTHNKNPDKVAHQVANRVIQVVRFFMPRLSFVSWEKVELQR